MTNTTINRPKRPNALWSATDGVCSPEQQCDLILSATKLASNWRIQLFYVGIGLLVCAAIIGIAFLAFSDADLAFLAIYPAGIMIAILMVLNVGRRQRHFLSQILFRHHIRPNFCLRCKYDLKGSVSDACPECGEPLALFVESGDAS